MFEFLRKFSLLMLLFVVGLGTYLSAINATDWKETLWVQVYPISGDGSPATAEYIERLEQDDFQAIETFMKSEADRYRIRIDKPVRMILGRELHELPPAVPVGGNFFQIGFWSLKLRWWSSSVMRADDGPKPDIQLFLVYFDPAATPVLNHSVGLQKGRVGIVNVFSSRGQTAVNNFVIAHEMLHTLGATDKYSLDTLMPVYPEGFAVPLKTPVYPQSMAEIMGGRRPLSETEAVMPAGLREARVGASTAEEIRWLR